MGKDEFERWLFDFDRTVLFELHEFTRNNSKPKDDITLIVLEHLDDVFLIVDDEPNARKVLSAILSDSGYSIVEAKDAERGIKTLDKVDVDAVITDLKMPEMDGVEVVKLSKFLADKILTSAQLEELRDEALWNAAEHTNILPRSIQMKRNALSWR
jgi:PleD family two-component response regulator